VRRIILKMAVAATTYFCAFSSIAAVSIPYGWYVSANGGWSKVQHKNYPGPSSSGNGGVVGAAGYKFSPFLAVEGIYSSYSSVNIHSAGWTVARDRFYSYGLLGKVIFPIASSGFSLFGKVGVGRLISSLKVTNPALAAQNNLVFNSGTNGATGLYLGAGAEYSFTTNLLGNIQWLRLHGNRNTGNMQFVGGGFAYLF